MGKRDAALQSKPKMGKQGAAHQMTPVDQYRHRIGRQESKQLLKRETKQRKRKESERVQKSGAVGYVCTVLIIFMLILTALYLVVYVIAQKNESFESIYASMPFLKPIFEYVEKMYDVWVKPMLPGKSS
jgi:hypothetical protein